MVLGGRKEIKSDLLSIPREQGNVKLQSRVELPTTVQLENDNGDLVFNDSSGNPIDGDNGKGFKHRGQHIEVDDGNNYTFKNIPYGKGGPFNQDAIAVVGSQGDMVEEVSCQNVMKPLSFGRDAKLYIGQDVAQAGRQITLSGSSLGKGSRIYRVGLAFPEHGDQFSHFLDLIDGRGNELPSFKDFYDVIDGTSGSLPIKTSRQETVVDTERNIQPIFLSTLGSKQANDTDNNWIYSRTSGLINDLHKDGNDNLVLHD